MDPGYPEHPSQYFILAGPEGQVFQLHRDREDALATVHRTCTYEMGWAHRARSKERRLFALSGFVPDVKRVQEPEHVYNTSHGQDYRLPWRSCGMLHTGHQQLLLSSKGR